MGGLTEVCRVVRLAREAWRPALGRHDARVRPRLAGGARGRGVAGLRLSRPTSSRAPGGSARAWTCIELRMAPDGTMEVPASRHRRPAGRGAVPPRDPTVTLGTHGRIRAPPRQHLGRRLRRSVRSLGVEPELARARLRAVSRWWRFGSPSGPFAPRNTEARAVAGLIIHLIPHTHWDREWYLPARRLRRPPRSRPRRPARPPRRPTPTSAASSSMARPCCSRTTCASAPTSASASPPWSAPAASRSAPGTSWPTSSFPRASPRAEPAPRPGRRRAPGRAVGRASTPPTRSGIPPSGPRSPPSSAWPVRRALARARRRAGPGGRPLSLARSRRPLDPAAPPAARRLRGGVGAGGRSGAAAPMHGRGSGRCSRAARPRRTSR